MNEEIDIDSYIEKARNHLNALTEAHVATWGLGSAERWDANQEEGVITWSFSDGRTVSAPFQIMGTYNTLDQTYLWAWNNSSILDHLQEDAKAVLDFAKTHDIDFLQDRKVGCDEDAAWDLAALATLICDKQGVYRGPAGTTLVFITFGEVQITNPT